MDFSLNYNAVSFAFDRIYNSYTDEWFYSTESVVNTTGNSNLIMVVLPDSSIVPFVKTDTNKYLNDLTGFELEQTTTGYSLKSDDVVYKYDTNGKLTVVTNKYDDEITITRTNNAIIVRDEANRNYTINLNTVGNVSSITDPAGNTINYTYSDGKLIRVNDQEAVIIGQYAYTNGRLSKSMDKNIVYDSHGRVTQYLYDSNYHEDFTYNDLLNRVSIMTSSDNSTSVTCNDEYLPIENIDESGTVSEYTYDSNFNVLSETVNGDTTTNTYNEAGLLISSEDAEGNITTYSYDQDGNIIRECQEEEYTYYVYNTLGDIIVQATLQEDYDGNTPAAYSENLNCFDLIEYEYSGGLVIQTVDTLNEETTEYAYDIYGNTASITTTVVEDEQTSIDISNSTYDIMGNILTTSDSDNTSSFIYDKAGRVLLANNNGEYTRTLYDSYGRPVQEIAPGDYEAADDGLTSAIPINTYANATAGKTFVYNDDFTLASETNSLGVITTYTYDSDTGTKKKEAFDIYEYYYLPHGEIDFVKASGQVIVFYEYDNNYNLIKETHPDNDTPYTSTGGYSGPGSSTAEIIVKTQEIIHYQYDNDNNLVSQRRDDESSPYITYTYTNGKLSQKVNNDTGLRYVYLTNSLNDVMGISDTSGTVLVQYAYDEWGKLINTSAGNNETLAQINPLRYRGYYYDTETSYYYLQSRYYNPEICRFISADDYTNIETKTVLKYNLFIYCENDPIDNDDKNGLISSKYAVKTNLLKSIHKTRYNMDCNYAHGLLHFKLSIWIIKGNYNNRKYVYLDKISYSRISILDGNRISKLKYTLGTTHWFLSQAIKEKNGDFKKFSESAPKKWLAINTVEVQDLRPWVGMSISIKFRRGNSKTSFEIFACFSYTFKYAEIHRYVKGKYKDMKYLPGLHHFFNGG